MGEGKGKGGFFFFFSKKTTSRCISAAGDIRAQKCKHESLGFIINDM